MNQKQAIESYEKLNKMFLSLQLIINKQAKDGSYRDAVIRRFKFTIELFWKFLKRILEIKGIQVRYPKDVLKEAFAGNLIENEQIWLNMLQDRNLTSHTYDEELADKIYAHIQSYFPTLLETKEKLSSEFIAMLKSDSQ